jgi:hypothetical protein
MSEKLPSIEDPVLHVASMSSSKQRTVKKRLLKSWTHTKKEKFEKQCTSFYQNQTMNQITNEQFLMFYYGDWCGKSGDYNSSQMDSWYHIFS